MKTLDTTAGELAERLGAELVGPPSLRVRGVDAIDRAGAEALTFIRDHHYATQWAASRAGSAVVTRGIEPAGHDASRRALLVVDDADRAMISVLELLCPEHVPPSPGVHGSASVDPTAELGSGVRIGPGVAIGARTRVGDGVVLAPNVVLGADVTVGDRTDLRAGVVIEDRCVLGRGVVIHPNTVIGADGFGYRPSDDGRAIVKIPHVGWVEIHDGVEIGSCTTVDRGKFGATVVGAGTKIDNQVQIGHNCRIGRGCIICGAVGIAGSVEIGDGVTLGGGVGIRDNLKIGAGANVGAFSGLMNDVPAGATVLGVPAQPIADAMRNFSVQRDLFGALRDIRKRLKLLERRETPTPAEHASDASG